MSNLNPSNLIVKAYSDKIIALLEVLTEDQRQKFEQRIKELKLELLERHKDRQSALKCVN